MHFSTTAGRRQARFLNERDGIYGSMGWDETVVNQQVLKLIEIPHVERCFIDMYNLYVISRILSIKSYSFYIYISTIL